LDIRVIQNDFHLEATLNQICVNGANWSHGGTVRTPVRDPAVAGRGYVACSLWIGLMRSAPALKMVLLNSDVTLFKEVLNQTFSQIVSTYEIAFSEQSSSRY
jgi:hypothetical protein